MRSRSRDDRANAGQFLGSEVLFPVETLDKENVMRLYSNTDFYKRNGVPALKLHETWVGARPEGWDGTAFLPSRSAEEIANPAGMLEQAIASCRDQLAEAAFHIDIDCRLDAAHYDIIPERDRVALFEGPLGTLVPAHFDLGGTNVGISADEMRAELLGDTGPILLLEPAGALLLLTRYLRHVACVPRQTVVMHIECAGARYSPNGNGKFDDVPRWDVYPPVGTGRGLVFLNWNWSRRCRPAQGVALAMDARP